MKYRLYRRIGWGLLLTALLASVIAMPVSASVRANQHIQKHAASTSINATIYLSMATLQPLFQDRINQQVPGAVSTAINGMVNQLSPVNRGWAQQMATTLIQPSATLTALTPNQDGLAATLQISLYPGDPKPMNASMLVKFSVLNGSTVQVSAQALNGGQALVNGPLTTLQIPIGQLNSIAATPNCGDAALAVNLQFPISLGGSNSASQSQQNSANNMVLGDIQQPQMRRAPADGVNSYVVIPPESLAALGDSIGSLSINSNLTAKNIQVSVQNSNLVITSDVMLGSSTVKLATATTYVQPMVADGNLAVHVSKTNLTVFSFLTFPDNNYNNQIQQLLNTKLNGALGGKFNVTDAAIGSNSHIPCAASDSLVLTGTASLG